MSEEDNPSKQKPSERSDKTGLEESRNNLSHSTGSGRASFWAELKRRKVMRVGITYAVMSWLIIQVASSTFGWFDIPKWAFQFVVIMLVTFFPVAIILAWAFELTPEGIKTTKNARAERGDAQASTEEQRTRNLKAIGFAAALPTLIFGALAAYFFLTRGEPTLEREKSIAVLPLQNLSPDPENAFFADGVQEDILTNLAKIDELLVISRSSTLQYREREKNLKEIGADLGVRYVVEGSVRRSENRVLVTVQLIDTETDAHLWAENFDRPLEDVFAMQSAIAKQIAGQLEAVLSPKEIAEINYRPTESQAAYDLYMKARLLIEESTERGDEKIELLSRSVVLDSDFAEAWAQLAVESVYWWRTGRNREDPALLALGEGAMGRAELLAPDSALTHYARGIFMRDRYGDFAASTRALERALQINTNLDLANNNLAGSRQFAGRFAEAQTLLERSLKTSPIQMKTSWLVRTLYLQGKWDEARSLVLENANRPNAEPWWNWRLAEHDYYRSGDAEILVDYLGKDDKWTQRPEMEFRKALLERDLKEALSFLNTQNPDSNFRFFNLHYNEPNFGPASLLSALVCWELGEDEQCERLAASAKASLETKVRNTPWNSPIFFAPLAVCSALLDQGEEMETAIERSRQLARASDYSFTYEANSEFLIAIAYLARGEDEKAIAILEAASKEASWFTLKREIPLWFMFDRLRGNSRFDALLK